MKNRSSRVELFCKKDFLKIPQNSQGTPVLEYLLNKVANGCFCHSSECLAMKVRTRFWIRKIEDNLAISNCNISITDAFQDVSNNVQKYLHIKRQFHIFTKTL